MKKYSLRSSIIFLILLFISSSANGEHIRLGVADFVDRTGRNNNGYPQRMTEITEVFTKILASSSEKIEVIGYENLQALDSMTTENATNAGRRAGCQYVVLGVLAKEEFERNYKNSKKGNLFFSYELPELQSTMQIITLDTRIIDVKTGEIVLSISGQGQALYDEIALSKKYSSAAFNEQKRNEMADEYGKIRKKALSSASAMIVEKLTAFFTNEYPLVTSIKSEPQRKGKKSKRKDKKDDNTNLGTITIDRGTSSGVNEEVLYRIYIEGEEVFDFSGNSLGREKFNLAVAEVKEAKFSYCTAVITGGNVINIREGDKAEQITLEEAASIIERKDFVKNRLAH